MRWLTNGANPKTAGPQDVARLTHETPEQALERYQAYARGKVIGPPQATPTYTVEELEMQGVVGIYAPDEVPS